MNFDEFKLITQRLELKVHDLEDADFLLELNSDSEVTRYVPDGPLESSQRAVELIRRLQEQFKERQIGRFIVFEKQTGKKIGWCGLKWLENVKEIDLGYRFLRSEWGKGFASEAAQACLDYGFNTLNFEKITARIAPENTASLHVAKKLGMNELGKVVEDNFVFIVLEISAGDFSSRQAFK